MIILNVLEETRMPALASHADDDGSVEIIAEAGRIRLLLPEHIAGWLALGRHNK